MSLATPLLPLKDPSQLKLVRMIPDSGTLGRQKGCGGHAMFFSEAYMTGCNAGGKGHGPPVEPGSPEKHVHVPAYCAVTLHAL